MWVPAHPRCNVQSLSNRLMYKLTDTSGDVDRTVKIYFGFEENRQIVSGRLELLASIFMENTKTIYPLYTSYTGGYNFPKKS